LQISNLQLIFKNKVLSINNNNHCATKPPETIDNVNASSVTNVKKKTNQQKQSKNPAQATNSSSNHHSQNKTTTVIIGDSILKNIHGYKIGAKIKQRIVVKAIPGSMTKDMKHYLKPSLDRKPDRIVLHVGTNDLKSSTALEFHRKNS